MQHMLRIQYDGEDRIVERLFPLGADLRCMSLAMDVLADGRAVMIEPMGDYQVSVRAGGGPDIRPIRH